jgi:predicted RNA binding protein YcfA (HicA-like mRNA interferase family)
MPKQSRWTAPDAGFLHLRSKGSHRIYGKASHRIVVPFHSTAVLHPKVIKQIIEIIAESNAG